MELVGHPVPIVPKPRVDAVVVTLTRLIVTCKSVYREPLLDVLYQYRRREGAFMDRPRWLKNRHELPILNVGVGTGGSNVNAPALPTVGTSDRDRRVLASPQRGSRLPS